MMKPDDQIASTGEILAKAGFLSEDDLADAQDIAKSSGQSTGRVLVMSGFVTELQLQLAAAVQEKLKDGRITVADAIRSVKRSKTGSP